MFSQLVPSLPTRIANITYLIFSQIIGLCSSSLIHSSFSLRKPFRHYCPHAKDDGRLCFYRHLFVYICGGRGYPIQLTGGTLIQDQDGVLRPRSRWGGVLHPADGGCMPIQDQDGGYPLSRTVCGYPLSRLDGVPPPRQEKSA